MLIHSPKELALLAVDQRKKLQFNQAEVGSQVGLKQQTISRFEIKPAGIHLDTLFRILSALNLDMKIVAKDETKTSSKAKWNREW